MLRPTLPCAEAVADLGAFDAIVDVRSPSEFALDHLPGAINCPVLDDEERVRVGTMHKLESAFAARRCGAALVARSIARHLEQRFAEKPRSWRPLVYCWRGGQRSGAMVHVLTSVGWPARQLEGGYRAFRRHVLGELDELPKHLCLRVVCGPTGSGKSRLLRRLADCGAQVLDLEAIACHRGSVLGALPLPQPSQKSFETQLWSALRAFDPRRPVFVESESRKVGQLRLPDALLERMRASECLQLQLPTEARVRLLRDEYAHFEADAPTLMRQLDCLVDLHGRDRVEEWKRLAAGQRWEEMVRRLLDEHYDPAYQRSIHRNFRRAASALPVMLGAGDETDFARAAAELAAG
ncbi:MAG: tRNA 2-selenouridine(34) synthase MnmH [Burkholderiales bacterium]|nr:tRNA 2-selenouridine(34) synthase MnmH [Burkholderiales bacterium]